MVGRSTLGPGEVFAGYTIERVLGTGGMATVYLAAHPRLPRRVALKLLHPELTRDDYVRSRFELEAEQAARLEHPNIVDVHDRGREGDQLWIAMKYVEGSSAGDAIRSDGAVTVERAVFVVTETAKALDYAHSKSVLHRDVKPDNILLERDSPDRRGRVLLADFGIAKALTETTRLTQTGMMVASLQYAAPEQFEGRALDARTDVYSLGCTLFHLLTGQTPYTGASLAELMRAHLVLPAPRPGAVRPGLSAGWDAVLGRALAKNPDDRYPSCGALAADAAHVLAGPRGGLRYSPPPVAMSDWHDPDLAQTRLAPSRPPQWRPSDPAPQGGPAPSRPPRWRRRLPVLAGVLVVIAGVTIGVVVHHADKRTGTTAQPVEHNQQATPVQTVLPFRGLNEPNGVAVDRAGNVYVVDERNKRVVELASGSTSQQTLPFTGLNGPLQVAVDAAGSVYVADGQDNQVVKLSAGSAGQAVLPLTGLQNPIGVAVDSAGNVYVGDYGNNRVVELAAGSNAQKVLPFTGLNGPDGVAVDSAGDVYVAEYAYDAVVQLPVGSSTQQALGFTGLLNPSAVAVDADKSVYVADAGNNRIVKLAAGSSAQQVLPFTGIISPAGVAVGPDGAVYITDTGNSRVVKLSAG